MEKYSMTQVLDIVMRTLANINVPVGLMEQVARPINDSIYNLQGLKAAIEKAEQPEEPIREEDVEVEVDGEG